MGGGVEAGGGARGRATCRGTPTRGSEGEKEAFQAPTSLAPPFQAAWPAHKSSHKPAPDTWAYVTHKGAGRALTLPAYAWTGPLRPDVVSPTRAVPGAVPRPDYAATGYPESEVESRQQRSVPVRGEKEIARARAACRAAREILDAAAAAVRPGVTTDELDRIVHEATVERGAYPSPLNYFNFPKSVCTSVNEVVCHGIPDARELVDGDIVNIDVTVFLGGHHGDTSRTFTVGPSAPVEAKRLIAVTERALAAAIAICGPGVRYSAIGDAIQTIADAERLGVVREFVGHGVGRVFHSNPVILHHRNREPGTMSEGTTFTIEPMLTLGSAKPLMWGDDWTCVTADGSYAAQAEHTLLVTKGGVEILTKSGV